MATASWLLIDPTSGSGNGTVNVSSVSEHTGREARTASITFSAPNCDDIVRLVSQAGKTEYVSIDSAATADKDGGTVTIAGTSNSAALTFTLGSTGDLEITLPATYTASGIEATSGEEIEGDPGANSEYEFSISIEVPKNDTTEEKTAQIIVTDDAGNQSTCTLTLAAAEPYLTIDVEDTISLDSAGNAVTVNVSSNTTWTVE